MAEKNKSTDIKKRDEERRAEITMMYIYMDRYPDKVREKMRKSAPDKQLETVKQRF